MLAHSFPAILTPPLPTHPLTNNPLFFCFFNSPGMMGGGGGWGGGPAQPVQVPATFSGGVAIGAGAGAPAAAPVPVPAAVKPGGPVVSSLGME